MKRVVFALAPSAILLVVILGAAEIRLRTKYRRVSAITGATPWETDSWGGLSYLWDAYHPRYGWTNLPGYRSDERVPFRVTINTQGLRGTREYAPAPVDGVRRIAVFGDSCTFGEEVDDDETVPAYLERHLRGAEVLNYGVRGYGLGQMMMRLEEEGLDLGPDHVVVLLLLPSDVYRDEMAHFAHNKPVFSLEGRSLRIGSVPVPEESRHPWLYRHSFTAAWLFGRARAIPEPDDPEKRMAVTHAILRRMEAAAQERGVPLTVVDMVVPSEFTLMQRDSRRAEMVAYMRRSLRGPGMDLLDAIDFQARSLEREGHQLMAPLAHWSARGNCLLAGHVAEALVKRGFAMAPRRPCAPHSDPAGSQ